MLWALGYRSEAAMDVGAIMAMERMGHELIAPLVFVLDNRVWGETDGAARLTTLLPQPASIMPTSIL